MLYLKQCALVLVQFAIGMGCPSVRHGTLACYRAARRNYLLPRLQAMEWAADQIWLGDDQLEQSIRSAFSEMMNRAWGDEDDQEWLGRYR